MSCHWTSTGLHGSGTQTLSCSLHAGSSGSRERDDPKPVLGMSSTLTAAGSQHPSPLPITQECPNSRPSSHPWSILTCAPPSKSSQTMAQDPRAPQILFLALLQPSNHPSPSSSPAGCSVPCRMQHGHLTTLSLSSRLSTPPLSSTGRRLMTKTAGRSGGTDTLGPKKM